MSEQDKQLAEAKEQIKKWKGLYTEATVRRAILEAADRASAIHPEQLVPILAPDAAMEEVKGRFVVYFQGTDEQGKQVRRTSDQAVAHMKKEGKHPNLFRDTFPQAAPFAVSASSQKHR